MSRHGKKKASHSPLQNAGMLKKSFTKVVGKHNKHGNLEK